MLKKIKAWEWVLPLMLLAACQGSTTIEGLNPVSSFITADESGKTLTIVHSGGLRQTIALPMAPHNVQVSADGKWVLATGMEVKDHQQDSQVMRGMLVIIKAGPLNEKTLRAIPLGEHPAHVVTDASGKTAYVTDSASNRVAVVDIISGKVKDWISVGIFPHGIRLNPVRGEFYTANLKDGTISIVDILSNKETRIPVGGMPTQVAVSPDGRKVYVTLAADNVVGVVDVAQRRKIKTIPVGAAPAQIYADPLGRYVYVANQGSKNHPGNTVSVIDISSDKVIKIIRTGRMPHGIVASADGRFVYVTNMGDNTVSQVDTVSLTVVNQYRVGESPNGITHIEGNH